jgi:hypothetical protein
MPRCQWCRQESATADVCEWCKRPLTAGWNPAAAAGGVPAAVAAPMPRDRMTFVQDDDAGKNDRVLVFAMLGVVAVTAIAFAVNYFTHKDIPPPVTPPAVSTPMQPTQTASNTQSPTPAVSAPEQENPSTYQAPAAPVTQVPEYQPAAAPAQEDYANGPGMQNSKLRGLRNVTDQG